VKLVKNLFLNNKRGFVPGLVVVNLDLKLAKGAEDDSANILLSLVSIAVPTLKLFPADNALNTAVKNVK
jgi:hypothetical protein